MSDDSRRPDREPAFDPRATPMPRRRVLLLMGAGALAAGGGLGVLLGACAGPPVTVTLDVDLATLEPGTPTEVPFTLTLGSTTVEASAWLVMKASGELVAFDPRCTHGLCTYRWLRDAARFQCGCHDGQFALDGSVLAGPPPRPLGQFPVRLVGDLIEVDVPGDFQTPKASLPA
jgi:Rieske Fe-S protein